MSITCKSFTIVGAYTPIDYNYYDVNLKKINFNYFCELGKDSEGEKTLEESSNFNGSVMFK